VVARVLDFRFFGIFVPVKIVLLGQIVLLQVAFYRTDD